jgi:NAD(P)-dependent dehydrogenase (short-subunit alcohol dehydrogenase family)
LSYALRFLGPEYPQSWVQGLINGDRFQPLGSQREKIMALRRTVLVTGAASGIGAAIARRFLAEDYSVVLFDIDAEGARRVAEDTGREDHALIVQGDAAVERSVREAVTKTEDKFGPVSVMVNNVGIEFNGRVEEQSREEWDRHVAVNLTSVFLFSKFCIPGMRASGGGAIINISSVHAFVSWPRCAAYDATKAGLLGVTRALAIDHGPEGVRVNAICPGYIRTPLLERWFSAMEDGEQEVARAHPIRRIGEPADVANAVFFLASEQASFITGAILTVDGGLMAAGR